MEIMPLTHKLCTFNCVYCECGWNEPVLHPVLPTREEIYQALEAKLQELQFEGTHIDVITFSGNGEPTLHPEYERFIHYIASKFPERFPEESGETPETGEE